jgi:hypothetical protein
MPGGLSVVVTKDEALRIIDQLAEDGFFKNAATTSLKPPGGPCYVLTIDGENWKLGRKGDTIMENLGWGDGLMGRLDSLRTVLNPDAAEKLGKLMTRAKELANTPGAIAEHAPQVDAAKRRAALRDWVEHVFFTLQHVDAQHKTRYELTLSTQRINRGRSAEFQHSVVIDKETALKLIDKLAESGVLERAWDLNAGADMLRAAPKAPCCLLVVRGAKMVLEDNLGWGDPLADQLKGIRALLAGAAADEMDKLLDSIAKESAK